MKHDDKAADAAMIHKHESHMHPGKPKTKFAAGGVTTAMRAKYGRNQAKLVNQFGGKGIAKRSARGR